VTDAWRIGVPFGLGLFVLALLATGPYFVPALSDHTLVVIYDGVTVVAFLAFLEAGRRAGRAAGAGYGALAGGIAGFLASLSGILQHALLTAAPDYARLVTDQNGHAAYLQSLQLSSGAAAMAGIFGAVIADTLLGVLLGLLGGLVGAYVRRPREKARDGAA
jgi:hypothetical protein